MLSEHVYIHIPFCEKKCSYCDFFSVEKASASLKKNYTLAIKKELEALKKNISRPLKSVYLGGGSPVLLGIENIKLILSMMESNITKSTELSIELNPEHLERDKKVLSALKTIGINRISLGIQSTSQKILKNIKRRYNKNILIKNIEGIKKDKIDLSFDFMFGMPGQSIEDLNEDLNFIKKQRPEHLSFYSFTPPSSYSLGKHCAPDELSLEMFTHISKTLKNASYIQYEISNYCLKSKECIHNLAYWRRNSYLGIGAGAHSFNSYESKRYWHKNSISNYINDPLSSTNYEKLDDKAIINEKIFLGLRLNREGFTKSLLKDERYKDFIEKDWLVEKNGRILITHKGLALLNYISSQLMH